MIYRPKGSRCARRGPCLCVSWWSLSLLILLQLISLSQASWTEVELTINDGLAVLLDRNVHLHFSMRLPRPFSHTPSRLTSLPSPSPCLSPCSAHPETPHVARDVVTLSTACPRTPHTELLLRPNFAALPHGLHPGPNPPSHVPHVLPTPEPALTLHVQRTSDAPLHLEIHRPSLPWGPLTTPHVYSSTPTSSTRLLRLDLSSQSVGDWLAVNVPMASELTTWLAHPDQAGFLLRITSANESGESEGKVDRGAKAQSQAQAKKKDVEGDREECQTVSLVVSTFPTVGQPAVADPAMWRLKIHTDETPPQATLVVPGPTTGGYLPVGRAWAYFRVRESGSGFSHWECAGRKETSPVYHRCNHDPLDPMRVLLGDFLGLDDGGNEPRKGKMDSPPRSSSLSRREAALDVTTGELGVFVRPVDVAGNIGESVLVTMRVDAHAPTLSFAPGFVPPNIIETPTVTMKTRVSDRESGVAEMRCGIDIRPETEDVKKSKRWTKSGQSAPADRLDDHHLDDKMDLDVDLDLDPQDPQLGEARRIRQEAWWDAMHPCGDVEVFVDLKAGGHRFTAMARDRAGNTSRVLSHTFTYQTPRAGRLSFPQRVTAKEIVVDVAFDGNVPSFDPRACLASVQEGRTWKDWFTVVSSTMLHEAGRKWRVTLTPNESMQSLMFRGQRVVMFMVPACTLIGGGKNVMSAHVTVPASLVPVTCTPTTTTSSTSTTKSSGTEKDTSPSTSITMMDPPALGVPLSIAFRLNTRGVHVADTRLVQVISLATRATTTSRFSDGDHDRDGDHNVDHADDVDHEDDVDYADVVARVLEVVVEEDELRVTMVPLAVGTQLQVQILPGALQDRDGNINQTCSSSIQDVRPGGILVAGVDGAVASAHVATSHHTGDVQLDNSAPPPMTTTTTHELTPWLSSGVAASGAGRMAAGGVRVAYVTPDGTEVVVLHAGSGRRLLSVSGFRRATHVALSPDGRTLGILDGPARTVSLFSARTGACLHVAGPTFERSPDVAFEDLVDEVIAAATARRQADNEPSAEATTGVDTRERVGPGAGVGVGVSVGGGGARDRVADDEAWSRSVETFTRELSSHATCLSIDGRGHVWVCDAGDSLDGDANGVGKVSQPAVLELSPELDLLEVVTEWPLSGGHETSSVGGTVVTTSPDTKTKTTANMTSTESITLVRPVGVAVDGTGLVAVADAAVGAVLLYDSVRAWAPVGVLGQRHYAAYNRAAAPATLLAHATPWSSPLSPTSSSSTISLLSVQDVDADYLWILLGSSSDPHVTAVNRWSPSRPDVSPERVAIRSTPKKDGSPTSTAAVLPRWPTDTQAIAVFSRFWAPRATLYLPFPPNEEQTRPFYVRIAWSEPVSDFTSKHVEVGGIGGELGALRSDDGGRTYTGLVSPTGVGTVTVRVQPRAARSVTTGAYNLDASPAVRAYFGGGSCASELSCQWSLAFYQHELAMDRARVEAELQRRALVAAEHERLRLTQTTTAHQQEAAVAHEVAVARARALAEQEAADVRLASERATQALLIEAERAKAAAQVDERLREAQMAQALQLEQIALEGQQRARAWSDAVIAGVGLVGVGLVSTLRDPERLTRLAGALMMGTLIFFAAREITRLARDLIWRSLLIPALVRESSRGWNKQVARVLGEVVGILVATVMGMSRQRPQHHPQEKKMKKEKEKEKKHRVHGDTGIDGEDAEDGDDGDDTTQPLLQSHHPHDKEDPVAALDDVVLSDGLHQRMEDLMRSLTQTKARSAPYRHVLLYGPPGTGKTMAATRLARACGMDYALMSGGDVLPLGADAVAELNRLFTWARGSKRGLLLFIDEADAFLRRRGSSTNTGGGGGLGPPPSETLRGAINAVLAHSGAQQTNFVLVLATNRPHDLDDAVLDRIDETIAFPKPGLLQREAIMQKYFGEYVGRLRPAGTAIRYGPLGMWKHVCEVVEAVPDSGPARWSWSRWRWLGLTVQCTDLTEADFAEAARLTEGFSGREMAKAMAAVQARLFGMENVGGDGGGGRSRRMRLTRADFLATIRAKVEEHGAKVTFTGGQ